MAKKCMYCGKEIEENSVIDFCNKCGIGVWGERMFSAIVKNMEDAQEKGNINSKGLYLGEYEGKSLRKFK
jgi:uncharacterized membrane protein YvbJ